MLSDAIIEKEATGVYHITEAGVAELALSFPFVRFLVFPWDGKFRILSYEIPEKQRKYRDSLRREVSGWGLGPWHRSFWVTPHPIIGNLKKLTQGTSLELYVQAFEGAQVVGEVKTLLEKVWNLPALEAQYRKAFKNWHEYLSNESFTKEQKMRSVVDSYLEVLKTDPGLPPELVGKTWIGAEAWDIFQEMRNILVT
jgi:phenylacetic acid degradation operon negative regulatory protein